MKEPGRQIFLWHFAICCLPLLLIYLSLFGTARVIGWLTSWPALLIAGLVLVGLLLYSTGRRRGRPAKKEIEH
ncbi:MAG: hypothetical protein ACU843_14245 [Gammaproteobacteria bacterium]